LGDFDQIPAQELFDEGVEGVGVGEGNSGGELGLGGEDFRAVEIDDRRAGCDARALVQGGGGGGARCGRPRAG
jgi:hypothetical protein